MSTDFKWTLGLLAFAVALTLYTLHSSGVLP